MLVKSLFFAAKVRLLAGLEGGAAFGATTHFGEETGARLGHVFLPPHGSGGWSDESDAWKCSSDFGGCLDDFHQKDVG